MYNPDNFDAFYQKELKYKEVAINTVDTYMLLEGIEYSDATFVFNWTPLGVYVTVFLEDIKDGYMEYYDFVSKEILDSGQRYELELSMELKYRPTPDARADRSNGVFEAI